MDDRPAPRDHPAGLDDERLLGACEQKFLRRSGPGGQNRNKVETAVILRHGPSGLVAEANERRSQSENRREALRRLRFLLAIEVRTPVDPLAAAEPALAVAAQGGADRAEPGSRGRARDPRGGPRHHRGPGS